MTPSLIETLTLYQVQIDHGDYWSGPTDVLAASPRLSAIHFLRHLAEEDSEWCSREWLNLMARLPDGDWEFFQMRAQTTVVVEDLADFQRPSVAVSHPDCHMPQSPDPQSAGETQSNPIQ